MNRKLIVIEDFAKSTFIENYSNKPLTSFTLLSLSEYKDFILPLTTEIKVKMFEQFGIEPHLINEIYNYLFYLEDRKYESEKLNTLLNIKKLFKSKEYFLKSFSEIELYLEKNSLTLFLFKDYQNCFVNEALLKYTPKVIKAQSMQDELLFVASNISNLLKSGVPFEKIKLCNISNDYRFLLRKTFNNYHLPFSFEDSLGEIEESQKLLDRINTNSFKEYLKSLDEELQARYISILNKYAFYEGDLKNIESFLIDDFKKTSKDKLLGIQEIDVLSLMYLKDDVHVFILNCNQGAFPIDFYHNNYLLNKEKEEINFPLDYILQSEYSAYVEKAIFRKEHLTISYKLISLDNSFEKSLLINENIKEEEIYVIDVLTNSENETLNALTIIKQNYHQYNPKKEKEIFLFSTYRDVKLPKPYNNEFHLSKETNRSITISASSLDTFYMCQYRFYLQNILRLPSFPQEVQECIKIGDKLHMVMKRMMNDSFSLQEEIKEILEVFENNSNKKILYFFNILKPYFENQFNNYYQLISINKELVRGSEDDFEFKISQNNDGTEYFLDVKIDDFLVHEEEPYQYVLIIDFKSSNNEAKTKDTFYADGLNLQLPFYLYAITTYKAYYRPLGYQYLNILENKEGKTKAQGKLLKDNFVFNLLESEAKDYLKVNQKQENIVEENYFLDLNNLIKTLTEEMVQTIKNNDYKINPLMSKDWKLKGCDFCAYVGICYRKSKDYRKSQQVDEEDEE
ncbi:MAG: PD-(D/E)XK nuclease family protein [Bacillales bacterium]|jgi:ATP-dependent helicase/DNAse subunit B|nr:PD-(D/E)XK nuclease family protein [Bacillales bacterium]